jgi:tRNA-dihydrouridine synthase B
MIEAQTFWQTLPRPLIGLAPMKGVTDHPFRHMQKKYGRPALIYTEFVAVEALAIKNRRLLKDLMYDDSQRPIIAQVYGRTPALFRQMAVILCELGFDGIDINMGCPTRSVAQHGSGAALIKTPDLAQEIIAATKAGVHDWLNGATVRNCRSAPRYVAEQIEAAHAQLAPAHQARRLVPVSVKTRVGYAAPQVQEWIPRLLEREPAAISLHGRTLRQGYSGLAD